MPWIICGLVHTERIHRWSALWFFCIEMLSLYSFTSETHDVGVPLACRALSIEGMGCEVD